MEVLLYCQNQSLRNLIPPTFQTSNKDLLEAEHDYYNSKKNARQRLDDYKGMLAIMNNYDVCKKDTGYIQQRNQLYKLSIKEAIWYHPYITQ